MFTITVLKRILRILPLNNRKIERGIVLAAKNNQNKQQRRNIRLQKAKQWVATYQGTSRQMVRHYKKRFHLDTTCALADLQAIGVEFTQEYLDAVKKSEADRICIINKKIWKRNSTNMTP